MVAFDTARPAAPEASQITGLGESEKAGTS